MEYVSGGELFTAIKRNNGLPHQVARFYAGNVILSVPVTLALSYKYVFSAEIVVAIEYLHAHNVVHRDLKPENLLVQMRHIYSLITTN